MPALLRGGPASRPRPQPHRRGLDAWRHHGDQADLRRPPGGAGRRRHDRPGTRPGGAVRHPLPVPRPAGRLWQLRPLLDDAAHAARGGPDERSARRAEDPLRGGGMGAGRAQRGRHADRGVPGPPPRSALRGHFLRRAGLPGLSGGARAADSAGPPAGLVRPRRLPRPHPARSQTPRLRHRRPARDQHPVRHPARLFRGPGGARACGVAGPAGTGARPAPSQPRGLRRNRARALRVRRRHRTDPGDAQGHAGPAGPHQQLAGGTQEERLG